MALAYLTGSFGLGGSAMLSLLVPLRAVELGAPPELVGLIVGAHAIVPAALSVPSGALIDHVGPRRAFIAGVLVSAVVGVAYTLTTSYWALLVLQPLSGFSQNLAWVAGQTYITGIGTAADRATLTGRFGFATNSGTMMAPLIAGAAAQILGYQWAFLALVLAGAVFACVGLGLPEATPQHPAHPEPSSGRAPSGASTAGYGAAFALLRLRGIQTAMLLTFVRLWIWTGWSAFFAIFLAQNGFSPAVIGTILAAKEAVATVTALSTGRLSRLASKATVTAVGLSVGALGMALSPHITVMPFVYLPTLLLGFGSGISLPMLMAIMGDYAPPSQRGVAMGLRTTGNRLAGAVAPVVVGALVAATGTPVAFAASAVVAWAIIGAAVWLHGGGKQAVA